MRVEKYPDATVANSDCSAYGAYSQPFFVKCYRRFCVPLWFFVVGYVLAYTESYEVFGPVVPLIPIDVVDSFRGEDFPAERFFHDYPVFIVPDAADSFPSVMPFVVVLEKSRAASGVAKVSSCATSAWRAKKGLFTLGADDLPTGEVPCVPHVFPPFAYFNPTLPTC